MSEASRDRVVRDPAALPPDLPVPIDDGAADHLRHRPHVPPVRLPATDGTTLEVGGPGDADLLFCYPHTGQPGERLPEGWDRLPGARGCTPEACGFRDVAGALGALGHRVLGVSTDTTDHQREAVERLALTYPLLSDARLALAGAWRLPTFAMDGRTYLTRLTLLVRGGTVARVWYPVFPPDRHAADVLAALREA